MKKKCRVEVVDLQQAVMVQGLIVMAAARAAKTGASFEDILEIVRTHMPRLEMRAAFDTLEYLQQGGRIGKTQALLGSLLKVNPIIGLKDGEVFPFANKRSRAKAIDCLCNFVMSYPRIEELAIEYAAVLDEAEMLAERPGARLSR